jgi:DNA repair and recombination protein RAD52
VIIEPLHDPKLVPDEEDASKAKVVAAFFAKARVTVWSPDGQRSIVREGCGAARGFAKTAGEAIENALKAAETDALKRALVTFGNAFGLTLYNREPGARGQVASERREQPLDTAFIPAQRAAPTTSQRAIAATRRPNGRATDVSELPV